MRYLSRAGWFLVLVCWCSLACVAPASAADRIYYYHNDHLGTPVAMTDESGQVVWRADYEPFGAANVTVSNIENNFRFPGQYCDGEAANHYNYFRQYDSMIGRYLSPDPLRLPGNPYWYANASPITLIDPLGLFESNQYLRATVPGQVLFDYGMTALENNTYPLAGLYFVGMIGEQALFALTLGESSAARGAAVCEQKAASNTGIQLWPSASGGRQVINGIEYTTHALDRMAPVGVGGRGVPPSVVENVIRYGTKATGNEPGTLVHALEHVKVVTNLTGNVVITVYKTGR